MTRGGRRRVVDRAQAVRYRTVAKRLHESAHDLTDLAEGDRSGNAIAILAVHAAIAWVDALCIAWGGFKSTEGEHLKSVDALKDALGARADANALKILLGIVQQKDTVSYQGVSYGLARARTMLGKLDQFAAWAEELYESRPA